MTSRSLPLLLLVTVFGFFTTEIWQTAGMVQRGRVWLILAFFGIVSAPFLLSVMSAELRSMTGLSGSSPEVDLPAEHPFHALATGANGGTEPAPPLTRIERANMVFMLLLTQLLQAVVVGILAFVIFAVLGWLAVPQEAIRSWTNHAPTPGTLFGIQVPMANEELQVCLFIAGFSALYFVVAVLTDAAHRRTFFDPVLDHLKVSLAVRAVSLLRYTGQRSSQPPQWRADDAQPA
ncbi:MAG TPA: hypothetical protein VI248_14105 [Kineosporiaceae bacterium]